MFTDGSKDQKSGEQVEETGTEIRVRTSDYQSVFTVELVGFAVDGAQLEEDGCNL